MRMIPTVEQQELIMADFVGTPADCKTASVTSGELSEAELSMVAGGAEKVSIHLFSITKHIDKASPVLFL